MTIDTADSRIQLPSIETTMLPSEVGRLSQYFEGYASQRTVGILKEREPFFPLQLGFYCQLLGGEVWPCDSANSEDLCSEATLRFMLRNVTDGSRSGGYVGAEGRIELSQIRSLVRYLQTLLLP
ncbi:MAG: hypothetical protein IPK19_27140 [Chloroflexi bacterium]|nr:hypothetical protein [Chloroflexota bacterium]